MDIEFATSKIAPITIEQFRMFGHSRSSCNDHNVGWCLERWYRLYVLYS